ncbi:MAG: Uma2 family endonuclease [Bacteroidia bacterium]|nr:Uma2 family endonuclease [Bacteroidia bacterium]
MAEPAPKLSYSTPEAYLEAESASSSRHEYQDGLILDMAGGSVRHDMICMNLYADLRNGLRGKPCRAFSANMKLYVQAANAFYYPDAWIVCGEPRVFPGRNDALTDAATVFEVLSPATEARDRGEKFMSLQLLPGLMEYILIHQNRRTAEIFRRQPTGVWMYERIDEGPALALERIGLSLAFDSVYEGVIFPEA